MTARQTAKEIDDEAADWALRIDHADWAEQAHPQLQDWLAGDARRSGALLRAQAALSVVDRARALNGGEISALFPVRRPLTPVLTRRGLLIAGGAGGAIAAGVGGAMFVAYGGQRYRTALGEIRRVPLADGTMVALNTQSVVDVALRSRTRNVRLDSGEAWFEVAKDASRPFVVAAGPARIRAVGTAFSVRHQPDGAEVLVTEGVVETWLAGHEQSRTRSGAGVKIAFSAQRPPVAVQAPQEIERSLAWLDGHISLDGESLAAAAAEFNRYNARPIIIDDPVLAKARFVGLFQTDDPQSFAAAVAASTGARLAIDDQAIRLGRLRQ